MYEVPVDQFANPGRGTILMGTRLRILVVVAAALSLSASAFAQGECGNGCRALPRPLPATVAAAQLGDILRKADEAINHQSAAGLSNDKIIAGLKQALQVSTGKAVALTGRPDGFLKNAAIKILLPPKLQTVGKGMRMFGMGQPVDDLEVGMNRAAEQATPQAKRIFIAAVKKMTFSDARQILTGDDTAATEYFQRTSSNDLTAAFSPIVNQAMQRVGVVQQYNRLLASAPGGSALGARFDLNSYVVEKTLDGLFLMLGNEERKIRKDPAAQTTALLKEVFGGK